MSLVWNLLSPSVPSVIKTPGPWLPSRSASYSSSPPLCSRCCCCFARTAATPLLTGGLPVGFSWNLSPIVGPALPSPIGTRVFLNSMVVRWFAVGFSRESIWSYLLSFSRLVMRFSNSARQFKLSRTVFSSWEDPPLFKAVFSNLLAWSCNCSRMKSSVSSSSNRIGPFLFAASSF